FRQKDNWEFKVTSMALLSDLRDKMAKCLTITLPLHELSSDFIAKMDDILKLNSEQNAQRNCQLKFAVLDYESETAIELPAKSFKIYPSNEFLDELAKFNGVKYKLN
ncbi:MAG TPA: hypothetical protein VGD90_06235, partial [Sphingobacteriaceae bacterium]